MSKNKATLIGLMAVLLWSSLVGTIRIVSENLGAIGGTAMIYSLASILLLFTVGLNKMHKYSLPYLIAGGILFVSYELCFSLSIAFANNGQQAIEVSMLNYLWPTLTILSTILFNQQKANFLIIPGAVLPVIGIGWVLGGEQGFNVLSMLNNIKDNPLSYFLALIGACIWATYCLITVRFAKGKNAVTLFFLITAIILWAKYLMTDESTLTWSYQAVIYLFLASAAIGFGYAAWNIGVLHGNVTLLTGASYFIPILSASLSALLLNTPLSLSFWQGTALVTLGAILCWLAIRGVKNTRKFSDH